MCGLVFKFKSSPGDIHDMLFSIYHRGRPLHTHTWSDKLVELGHTRLPIQDLSDTYDQPIEYKKKVFLFAGEIYNFKKLDPKAKCDTQVLIDLWNKMGSRCVELFEGMFSIVVYDQQIKQLYVVTDPLAKKPLYMDSRAYSIASEIKTLTVPRQVTLNPEYYSTIIKHGYQWTGKTYDDQVVKLPARTILNIDLKDRQVNYYRQYIPLVRDHHLLTAMKTAVENRLISDVPISLLLSGGLDSSIIYKLIEKKTHNFTVFHIENQDDTEYLNYLNIPSDIEVITLKLDPQITDRELRKVLYYNEGCQDLGSMLPQYYLCEKIKHQPYETPVVITGDGADELFLGYTRANQYDSRYSDIFEELVYYHLPRLDKMSMAHTLELRSPFLSWDVVQAALQYSYKQARNKAVLKDLFKDLVPQQILNRKKTALKSSPILSDPIAWRRRLCDLWLQMISEDNDKK